MKTFELLHPNPSLFRHNKPMTFRKVHPQKMTTIAITIAMGPIPRPRIWAIHHAAAAKMSTNTTSNRIITTEALTSNPVVTVLLEWAVTDSAVSI